MLRADERWSYQRLHSREVLFLGQSSCRVTSRHAGLKHGPDLPENMRGRSLWQLHLVEGKERGPLKDQPFPSTLNALLRWACAKHPDENHTLSHPETFH